MGKGYLIDSNVIIDFCHGRLNKNARHFLSAIEPEISIITNIELFSSKNISIEEYKLLKEFVAISKIHPVDINLVEATASIRQEYKIKLPDAIIAATALVLGLELISRNVADFKNIKKLTFLDPYTM